MDHDDIDRSLIDAARGGLGPSDADRARLRRAVKIAVAGGAAAGTVAASSSASAAVKGALGGWALTKTVLIGASAVAIALGATYAAVRVSEDDAEVAVSAAPEHRAENAHRSGDARHAPHVESVEEAEAIDGPALGEVDRRSARVDDVRPADRIDDSVAPSAAPSTGGARTTPERASQRASAHDPVRASAPEVARVQDATARDDHAHAGEAASEAVRTAQHSSEAPPAAPSLALGAPSIEEALTAETALLRDAHRALRAEEPARALELLDQHAARFPNGVLAEERSATRVLALCDAGRTEEARAEAARFLAAHARSMHAARVRASRCAPAE